jgi:hypothetical protein
MPGSGRIKFAFVQKPPIVFWVLIGCLFANSFVGLGLDFLGPHILSKASATSPACDALSTASAQYYAPYFLCRWASHFILIQWVVLGLTGLVMLIYRERVEYIGRGK